MTVFLIGVFGRGLKLLDSLEQLSRWVGEDLDQLGGGRRTGHRKCATRWRNCVSCVP
ncbi:hypothetical protein GGR20_001366 [Devosia subaequoris]|uniref:Uncharacterized protein n=1 Tax=Devosia subaequoris TaxID=395930 RepID=A0A7W6IMM2_9HYPH|nr:hypothetical protein [Devosia subaequoris]